MENYVPQVSGDQYYWRGSDDRGLELEILAIDKPDCLLVIHFMPMNFRRKRDEQEDKGR
jgi:hypothetical protein